MLWGILDIFFDSPGCKIITNEINTSDAAHDKRDGDVTQQAGDRHGNDANHRFTVQRFVKQLASDMMWRNVTGVFALRRFDSTTAGGLDKSLADDQVGTNLCPQNETNKCGPIQKCNAHNCSKPPMGTSP